MTFPTPSALPEETRRKVRDLLQPVILTLAGLSGIARKAHWNVRGPMFSDLHKLFGDLYTATSDHADALAEHVAILGLEVEGDHVDVGEASQVTRMPSTLTAGRDLARAVGDRLRDGLILINEPKAQLVALGDDDAQQKIIDVSLALSKIGWKIVAHVA